MKGFLGLKRIRNRIRRALGVKSSSVHPYRHHDFDGGDLNQWIASGIAGYQQWYQHVDFGNGLVANVSVPPEWVPDPTRNAGSGLDRWNFIIKRNLPRVEGLRVLDLGCNVGLYSIELARLGAREIIGVDRDLDIAHNTGTLPKVDLVSQAEFVKQAFQYLEKVTFPVKYLAIDFRDISALKELGRFDLILALNVVYHELDRAPTLLRALSEMTDNILLQSSVVHPPPIQKWASPIWTVAELQRCGFSKITLDSPAGYLQPVVFGTRYGDNN